MKMEEMVRQVRSLKQPAVTTGVRVDGVARFPFRKDQDDAADEIFYLNKTKEEVSMKYDNISREQLAMILAKKRIIWDGTIGLWRNLNTGTISPGVPRKGIYLGTDPNGGHLRAGGLNWTQQDLDTWVDQIINGHASVDGIANSHPICKTTVKKALHKRSYRSIIGVGWTNN